MALFGQQLQVKRIAIVFGYRVNQGGNRSKMHYDRIVRSRAKFAVEVPKIYTRRQWHAPLPFDVFADLVLGGVQHAITIFSFDV